MTHNGHALRILAGYSSRPLTLVGIAVSLASSVLMSRPWEKAPRPSYRPVNAPIAGRSVQFGPGVSAPS
jgi:hypothetical protein